MIRVGASALVLTLLAACQEYPFVYRPRQRVAITTVREVVIRDTNTDILFVVDNSGSMIEEQENLKRNMRVFIEELSRSENAYRVGVITTDGLDEAMAGRDGGRLRMSRASQAQLDAAGCNIAPDASGARYLERPALDDPEVEAKRCRLVEDFAATVTSIGTNGSGTEVGLMAAQLAFDPSATDVAAHNAGFMRPEADLALVFLTDEEDCSMAEFEPVSSRTNAWCYEQVASAIPVADYVAFFAGLKGTDGVRKIRGALIGGGTFQGEGQADFTPSGCHIDSASQPSANCGCWSSSPDDFFCAYLQQPYGAPCTDAATCDPRCDAVSTGRYFDFLQELRRQRLTVSFPPGTFQDSICQPEYDQTLLNIARTVVLSNCFVVAEDALSVDSIRLLMRHQNDDGSIVDTEIPRIDETDPTATCQACGSCATGAWRYVDARTFCLDCGLKKGTADEFVLTVINEVVGVEDGAQE